MKYYICDFKNGTVEILEEVEYAFIEQCNNTIKKLNYYTFVKGLHEIWMENTMDFFRGYSNTMKFFKENIPNVTTIMMKKETLKCNKLLFNFLTSFRTLVDKLQETSKNMILSTEYEKNIINKFYDENLEYAFIYKLRNFAVHYGMVFNNISADLNNVKIECTKAYLMSYPKWNEKNKEFLSKFSDTVPIYECVKQVSPIIEAMYMGFIQYFCKDFEVIDKELTKLFEKYNVENPRFIVCEDISQSKLENGCTMLGFSYEQYIEFVKEAQKVPGVTFVQGKRNNTNSNE